MITAISFAHSYSSFWKECFPALESYIRVINSGGYIRKFDEKIYRISPSRSFLVSEVAFCLLKQSKENIDDAFEEAVARLQALPGAMNISERLNDTEKNAALNLASRNLEIINTMVTDRSKIVFSPMFPGCGALSQSFGDVLSGSLLIEIKSVDRGFRATDFRQLITYVLQNFISGNSSIENIGVINPRKGIYYKENLERFLFDTCAPNLIDLQNKFLSSIGFGGISR